MCMGDLPFPEQNRGGVDRGLRIEGSCCGGWGERMGGEEKGEAAAGCKTNKRINKNCRLVH